MKRALEHKRSFTYKDVVRSFILLTIHFLSLFAYVAFVLLMRYVLTNSDKFIPNINLQNFGLIYALTLAPVLNTTLHIIYSEKGGSWVRLLMWIHLIIVIVMTPIFAFSGEIYGIN